MRPEGAENWSKIMIGDLVEKAGKMNVYFQKHARSWTDEEWLQRRRKLLELLEEMDERLAAADAMPRDFGWTFSPDAQWKRVGEPDPPSRVDWDEISREFPQFWKAYQREEREEQVLTPVASDSVGSCPF